MIRNRLASVLAVSILAACASTQDDPQAPASPAPSASSSPSSASPAPVQRPGVAGTPTPAPRGSAAAPSASAGTKSASPGKNSVYFDYDKDDIKPEYRGLLEEHARYLRENPTLKARIEGNADERGSREYNLALGQRRAEAVAKTLKLMGIPESRLEAISYGEEKPRRTGQDESSWAENRRGDLVLGK